MKVHYQIENPFTSCIVGVQFSSRSIVVYLIFISFSFYIPYNEVGSIPTIPSHEPPVMRVRLDEEQFTSLIQGKEVMVPTEHPLGPAIDTKIILADIGYTKMIEIIEKQMN